MNHSTNLNLQYQVKTRMLVKSHQPFQDRLSLMQLSSINCVRQNQKKRTKIKTISWRETKRIQSWREERVEKKIVLFCQILVATNLSELRKLERKALHKMLILRRKWIQIRVLGALCVKLHHCQKSLRVK